MGEGACDEATVVEAWSEGGRERDGAVIGGTRGWGGSGVLGEPHTGIITKVGFGDGEPCVCGVDEERAADDGTSGDVGETLSREVEFLRAVEAVFLLAGEAFEIVREGELSKLAGEGERGGGRGRDNVAEGNAVVVDAEDDFERTRGGGGVFLEIKMEFVEMIADGGALAQRILPGLIDVAGLGAEEGDIFAQSTPPISPRLCRGFIAENGIILTQALEFQTQQRFLDEWLVVEANAIGE